MQCINIRPTSSKAQQTPSNNRIEFPNNNMSPGSLDNYKYNSCPNNLPSSKVGEVESSSRLNYSLVHKRELLIARVVPNQ